MRDEELTAAVEGRPHWQIDEQGAVYSRPGAVRQVRLRAVQNPARASRRYLTSVVLNGEATSVKPWPTAASGRDWAENRARLT